MTADMSVAPEIARLAETVLLVPVRPAAPSAPVPDRPEGHSDHPLTLGTLACRLRAIAATPERWWGLVSFEPDRSVTITVEECAAYRAWLVISPPGDAGQSCDCHVATMIAGEATEGTEAGHAADGARAGEATEGTPASQAADGTPAGGVLRPGPVRVHGEPHALRGGGAGYSISLHARAHRASRNR